MGEELTVGDLVEVDAANLVALARVRSIDGDRMHLALEQGGFVQWTDEVVRVRRHGDVADRSWDARVTYSGASTVTLDVLGPTPRRSLVVPEPAETERDVESRR